MHSKKISELNYICVEGNIGAGKTTFVNRFSELTGRTTILERFSDNPFLASFYENPNQFAFPLEMSFLAERFQQLNAIFNSPDLFSKGYISDYTFLKTLIFAEINLKKEEYELFKRFYTFLSNQLPKPDLVIYLKTDLVYLKENISERGRKYEKEIDPSYLQRIESNYIHSIKPMSGNRTLVISYSKNEWANLDNIIDEIVSKNL